MTTCASTCRRWPCRRRRTPRTPRSTCRSAAPSLGTFPVDNTIGTDILDEYGTASVDVVVPPARPAGAQTAGHGYDNGHRCPGPDHGERWPNAASAGSGFHHGERQAPSFVYGKTGTLSVQLQAGRPDGSVEVISATGAKLGTATITGGKGVFTLAAKSLKPGANTLTLKYLGTSAFAPSTADISVQVLKAGPKVKVKVDKTVDKGETTKVVVKVNAPDDIKVKGKIKLVIKGTGKTFTGQGRRWQGRVQAAGVHVHLGRQVHAQGQVPRQRPAEAGQQEREHRGLQVVDLDA